MTNRPLPHAPLYWGLAGLIPGLLCIALAWGGAGRAGPGAIAGALYAALILSFLGGLWWMEALMRGDTRAWPYGVAVVPSLAGWAALLASLVGGAPVSVALVVLGLALLATPLGDRWTGSLVRDMPGWWRLRLVLAFGLGGMSLILGGVASL
ncbi:DUF3429 domain-containing protein [Sphingomonas sp. Leaf21]|jgi:hypothetical protein|uniref:DUF3429 domain-containing protein n=1 Tax=Sphingomonas sp. Leaf21 TaxID=2876550 RepID=UPI001E4F1EAE|nr:DUF3429 domain-containing protein [Sphingomonas sp. Leaf21]